MKKRSLALILGCAVLLFAGVIYAWSVLKTPIVQQFGFSKTQAQFCFTLTLCFFCLGGLISGLMSRRVSAKIRLLIAALLTAGGFCLVSANNGSILALDLAYGVLAGTGIGFVYNTVISAVSALFPDKKGLCSGCLMMAFGFSALILGKVASALFAASSFGWRKTFLFLGLLTGAVLVISAFVLKTTVVKKNDSAVSGMTTKEMLKTSSFYKLFLFFTLLAGVGSCAIGFGKDYFLSCGLGESAAVTVAGLLSVCNGLGRIFSGAVYDKCGIRFTQLTTSAVAIAAPLLSLLALVLSAPALAVIGLCLCAFSYGFSPTVSAALCSGFYGLKHFSLNFPVLNLVLIPAAFVSTLAGKLMEASGSYVSTFIVLTAMSVLGLVINLTIKEK